MRSLRERHSAPRSPSSMLEIGASPSRPPRTRPYTNERPSTPSRSRAVPSRLFYPFVCPSKLVVRAVLAISFILATIAILSSTLQKLATGRKLSTFREVNPHIPLYLATASSSYHRYETSNTGDPALERSAVTSYYPQDSREDRIPASPHAIIHSPSPNERYLAYLPHSGFHNQRVSLENALILARMLNRTLIIPPIRLGLPIRFGEFDKLFRNVALSIKSGLEHCPRAKKLTSFTPRECLGYDEYTMIPWSALVNLHQIAHIVPVVERWDSSSAFVSHFLNIARNEIAYLKDTQPYQFQIYDEVSNRRPLKPQYSERLNVKDLHDRYGNVRLLCMGSLFGSSRFRLKRVENLETRRLVRETMVFQNPTLVDVASTITQSEELRKGYFAVHLRIGDGAFASEVKKNVRLVWWSLLAGPMGVREENIAKLESDALGIPIGEVESPPWPLIRAEAFTNQPDDLRNGSYPNLFTTTSGKIHQCHSQARSGSAFANIEFPVYIATDAKDPRQHPSLQLFVRTLPCIVFLEDFSHPPSTSPSSALPSFLPLRIMPFHPPLFCQFPFSRFRKQPHSSFSCHSIDHLAPLHNLLNPEDELALEKFLLPFVDSMVAAKASAVLGTPHSTFSRFTVDVLHQVYHGRDIIERGRG